MESYTELTQPPEIKAAEPEYSEAPATLPRGYGPAVNQVRKDAYNWDICMVFEVGSTEKEVTVRTKVNRKVQRSKRKEQDIFSERAATIIKNVKQADLKYCLYKSVKGDHVFMLVAATEQRLKEEADRIDYDLELDSTNSLRLGKERKLKLATMTLDESDPRFQAFKKEQWEGLYGPYKLPDAKNPKRDELYRHYEKADGSTSPFRPADRIKLTMSILEADEKQHGADINPAKFMKVDDHPLVALFPLHDLPTRAKIWEECSVWHAVFHVPVGSIRRYFGEQIGFYFGFLQFYSAALIIPSILGVGFFIWQLIALDIDVKGLPAFALVIALWATLFQEFWKRQEATYRYKWGMAKFAEKEVPRPQFHGTWAPSPVDGKMVELFPLYKKIFRMFMGQSIVTFCGVLAIGAAAGLLVARSIWLTADKSKSHTRELMVAASVLNALQVQVGNQLYKRVAAYLNEWENYRTETDYENALIFKSFLFEWINSYATLIYIAFFKQSDSELSCGEDSCMSELRIQLGMVFVTQLVISNFIELAKPLFSNCRASKKIAKGDPESQISGPEEEFALETYSSPFADFDEIVIQYGYATLFVVALPITPLLYLFNNIVEMYLDSYKLCKLTRRPIPRGATNIGTWQAMLNLQGYLAVVSNCILITLVANRSTGLRDVSLDGVALLPSLIAFIASEHLLVLLKQAIAIFVPDVPETVIMRQRRQEYIVDALIWEMAVEDIHEDDIDHINDPDANIKDEIVDEKFDPEASSRNVRELYQLNRIPTSYTLGMAAVSGKAAYGEVQANAQIDDP